MERKILEMMNNWKKDPHRKPLIIHGARQVGKTYSILEFGKKRYNHLVYVNFEANILANQIFVDDLDPDRIIGELSALFREKINSEETLLFFDEIQACERALTSLKYFCEHEIRYDIIAAGSLLGVALNRGSFSFPVGKVTMVTMYPLDFEEFLWAMDEKGLADLIRKSYLEQKQMSLHEKALSYLRLYMLVGGMPEVIQTYNRDADFNLVMSAHNDISGAYLADMAKYASPSETTRIMAVYKSIPAQLAKENHKFIYRFIKSGARAQEYETAIQWLHSSGIIAMCHLCSEGKLPLPAYYDPSKFKIYMTDTGLLCSFFGIPADLILQRASVLDGVKGALAENYTCFSLVANGYTPYYWESAGRAEVDFLIQTKKGEVIPIEVKASDNVRSKSLARFFELYNPPYAIRLSTKNFGFDNAIYSVPLYASFCIME